MLFKLHYFFKAAGANALGILLGVYMDEYTDATPAEIGFLYMVMPFIGLIFKPIICSKVDRQQAHRKYLIVSVLLTALSFLPFVVIPLLGEQVYRAHPRVCWYSLISFKIMGDIAFGGLISIGDSLAINYATRIGTEFSTYRVWETISWMFFGFVTGHLNEIWFLPKYVAGFLILITSSLCSALIYSLWPSEYFEMVPVSSLNSADCKQQVKGNESHLSKMTRSLMPRDLVWAHAKGQLCSLATCGTCGLSSSQTAAKDSVSSKVGEKRREQNVEVQKAISKRAQISTLLVLLRRDPRIPLYMLIFVMAGAVHMPMSFLFMQLSDICHTGNACNFSELGGYVQISVASLESLLFIYISGVIKKLGRLNSLTLTFGLAFGKFLFYATIWLDVNPYWAIVSEMFTGLIYGAFLTFQVEMGHLFASEVEHIIPELIKRRVVAEDDKSGHERLKLSLGSTMQALTSSAFDGLGRGSAALAFGLIIDLYSYQILWMVLVVGISSVIAVIQATAVIERCFGLKLGFDHLQAAASSGPHDVEMGQADEGSQAAPDSDANEKASQVELKQVT